MRLDQLEELAEIATLADRTKERALPTLLAVFPIGRDAGFRDYPLGAIHQRVMAEAESYGLGVLDLTRNFRLAEERFAGLGLFSDLVHPSAAGNRLVAVTMIQWLCEADPLPAACDVFEALLESNGRDTEMAALVAGDQSM